MQSFDQYSILSHFQQLYLKKLVVYNVDDATIYIADYNFFDRYEEKVFSKCVAIPIRIEQYIKCILDGSEYIIVLNDNTKNLLRN